MTANFTKFKFLLDLNKSWTWTSIKEFKRSKGFQKILLFLMIKVSSWSLLIKVSICWIYLSKIQMSNYLSSILHLRNISILKEIRTLSAFTSKMIRFFTFTYPWPFMTEKWWKSQILKWKKNSSSNPVFSKESLSLYYE